MLGLNTYSRYDVGRERGLFPPLYHIRSNGKIMAARLLLLTATRTRSIVFFSADSCWSELDDKPIIAQSIYLNDFEGLCAQNTQNTETLHIHKRNTKRT